MGMARSKESVEGHRMIDMSTVGMIVIFVMAFGIVSWQADRVSKAEELAADRLKEIEFLDRQLSAYKQQRIDSFLGQKL